jgi:hypothetical protein
LIKTGSYLSRNIGKEDLTGLINRNLLSDGAEKVKEDTVLALDISDII